MHITIYGDGTVKDSSGNELLKLIEVASAVNEVGIRSAATGNNPALVLSGDNTNIGLNVVPKGSGRLQEGGVNVALESSVQGTPTLAAGAEATNAITVTITAKDLSAATIAAKRFMRVWIGDADGGAECAAAPNGGVSFGTGTVIKQHTADKQWDVLSHTTGQIVLTITESTAKSFWLMVELAGKVASLQITFA